MTNRFRIAVMALSATIVTVGASALRTPAAHAARICNNTACDFGNPGTCQYYSGHYCTLSKFTDSQGQVIFMCTDGEC